VWALDLPVHSPAKDPSAKGQGDLIEVMTVRTGDMPAAAGTSYNTANEGI